MPRISIAEIGPDDAGLALEVWLKAQHARGVRPGEQRRQRVRAKVLESVGATGHRALLAHYGQHPAGMLLAEPHLGDGSAPTGGGHLSMLFVDPAYWGCRIGTALVEHVRGTRPGQWPELSVWTRTDNRRALRLYASTGFSDTGERSSLQDGLEIMRLGWSAS